MRYPGVVPHGAAPGRFSLYFCDLQLAFGAPELSRQEKSRAGKSL